MLTLVQFYSFVTVLTAEFAAVNSSLTAVITDSAALRRDLPSLRKQHHRICEAVDTVDIFLAPWLGVTIVFNMMATCVMAFTLVHFGDTDGDIIRVIGGTAWLFINMFNTGTVCLVSSNLNSKVKLVIFIKSKCVTLVH